MKKTVAVVLTSATGSAAAATALQLADRLLERGHRVTVFAHGAAAELAVADSAVAPAIAGLLRRGVHGGTLDWVVHHVAVPDNPGRQLVPGVIDGDDADLWSFVRNADVVLSPGGGQPWRVGS